MEHVIYKDSKKIVEVLEWVEINGKLHPKNKRTTYFNSKDKPDFGVKDVNCAEQIFSNENLHALRNKKDI